MSVLRFTASGLVPSPTTLQIRVTREHPGRLPAGAPEPGRSLDDSEVLDNVRHFTQGSRGPRTRPCTALVLSGVELGERPALHEVVQQGRRWGLERVVLHLGRGQRHALAATALRQLVDEVVVVVSSQQDMADVAALVRAGLHITAVIGLDARTLPHLQRLARGLAAARPGRVVLTWPLGGHGPHAARVRHLLPEALAPLRSAGVATGLKGLPPCALDGLEVPTWRSRNRWYVDAGHQLDQALLFFPDVVRLLKVDDCRFCAASDRCDGVSPQALHGGRVPWPDPVRATASP